jgi:hypothetical protein
MYALFFFFLQIKRPQSSKLSIYKFKLITCVCKYRVSQMEVHKKQITVLKWQIQSSSTTQLQPANF